MAQIFTAILLTSGIGTALALILTLLKPITRKVFSGGWHYYMWLVVLLVMVLPIRLNLPEQPITTPPVSETVTIPDNQEDSVEFSVITEIHPEPIVQEQPIQVENVSTIQVVKDFFSGKILLFSLIWLMGTILLFLIKIISYLVFLIKIHKHSEIISYPEIKEYTKRKIRTRVSDTICSPLMIGVFRPTLLLPKTEITPEQLHNVLAHEMTHLKRNDILYKWFVSIVKCVHWFNPAIYLISKQINIDCEISCDLTVVKEMDSQQEKGYVETILTLLTHNNSKGIPLTTGMTGNKKTLKRRFTMIKNKIKVSKKVAIISGVLAIIILATTVFASGILNGTFLKSYNNSLMELNTDKVTGNDFNLLFVGLDSNNRADAIMLLTVQENEIKGLSIPRNTLLEGKRVSDIVATENGDQELIDALKTTLSIPIHYYAKMDLSAVKEIVDNVGGIDFEVPMDMVYDDPHQDLHINLKKGVHTLNGEGVCQLLQFRRGYPEGDLSRIQLHQQFIKEFIKQKLNKDNIDKAPEIFKVISGNIKTNYPISNLKQDMKIISAINSNNIIFETIPGKVTMLNEMPVYELDFGNEVFLYDSTPVQAMIEKDNNGRYVIPTNTIIAAFPDIINPISVTAYYAEEGRSLIQELAKTSVPYDYQTMSKVLTMQITLPEKFISGGLWFVYEFEDGTSEKSQMYYVRNESKNNVFPYVVNTYEKTSAELIQEYYDTSKVVVRSTYYELSDGTWKSGDYSYKYKLELTGRLNNAKKDSRYIILSNIKDITFEQAWKAEGLSSNSNDYFNPEIAVIVGVQSF